MEIVSFCVRVSPTIDWNSVSLTLRNECDSFFRIHHLSSQLLIE